MFRDKKTDLAKDAKAYVEKLSGMNSSDIKAEAQKIASALSATVAGSVSVTQDNAKTEITGLEPGYYLIKDKDSSLKGDEAYTEYILNIVADTTITPKTDVPSVEKKVKDTNDTTGDTTGWQGVGQAKAVIFFIIVAIIALAQNKITTSKEVQD